MDGWSRAKIKVWNLLYIVLKLCPSHFKLGILCSWTRGPFFMWWTQRQIHQQSGLSTTHHYPMSSPPENDIPNEYQRVKLLYRSVMKSVIELWEVNASHCEPEPLPPLFLYSCHPVYQKYVCCYCVHTIPITMIYNDTEIPRLPLSYWQ